MQLQASFGQCNATFMFGTGSPAGAYCQTACGRCPGVPAASGTSTAAGTTPAGVAGVAASPMLSASSPAGTAATGVTPAPTTTPAGCTDLPPPGSSYTCAQQVRYATLSHAGSCHVSCLCNSCCFSLQASFGQCGAAFMLNTGSPVGGYCQTTCGRCPGVPAAPLGGPVSAAPGTSPSSAPGSSLSPAASGSQPPAAGTSPAPASGASPANLSLAPGISLSPAASASPFLTPGASPSPSTVPSSSLTPGSTSAPGSSTQAGCTDLPPPGSSYTCAQQVRC